MKETLKQLKKMYQHTGYHKKFIALCTLIIITAVIEIMTIPRIVEQILDVEIPKQNIQGLLLWVCVYMGILLGQCYMILKHCEMRSILSRWIKHDLRNAIFEKLQRVKATFFDQNESGLVLQFLQEDTQNSGELFPIRLVEMLVMGLARFGIIIVFLIWTNVEIGCMILGLYILGFLVTVWFNRKTMTRISEIRSLNTSIYTTINEGIQNFLSIKLLGIVKQRMYILEEKLKAYNMANIKLEKIVSAYNTVFTFITSFSTIIIIYLGGLEVIQGVMTYAQIMIMTSYTSDLAFEFDWFIRHLTDVKESFFAYNNILDLLEKTEEEDLEAGEVIKEKITSIAFEHVYFSYNKEKKNIKDVSLEIKENEKMAIIGKTGAGKTTITNLLTRLYEPQKGEILINGKDYRKYSISSIRHKIGYIMQEVQIVPNTIIDNIRYVNKQISKEEIMGIFKDLKLHDKIMTLPKGYNSNIYEETDLLSAGEKQMINFARIMAMKPDIIILDEVTANLSWKNEELVKNAIKKVSKGRITIMIAHRLNMLENCQKVIEMKEGKINFL